jgi:hypothetical protein
MQLVYDREGEDEHDGVEGGVTKGRGVLQAGEGRGSGNRRRAQHGVVTPHGDARACSATLLLMISAAAFAKIMLCRQHMRWS